MRYWTYVEPEDPERDNFDPIYVTLSEEDILKEYWPHWYEAGCKKYGKEYVDANYSKQDCIDDWVVVRWAWESK